MARHMALGVALVTLGVASRAPDNATTAAARRLEAGNDDARGATPAAALRYATSTCAALADGGGGGATTDARLLSARSCAAVVAMAGIYRDDAGGARAAAAAAGADGPRTRSVLLTTANHGYREMLLSWMCRARELGLKFVVHAQDAKLRALLEAKGGGAAAAGYRVLYEESLASASGFQNFGSDAYTRLTCLKIAVVRRVVATTRLDVWLSDPDIGFALDPWPWFRHDADCDYTYEINTPRVGHAMLPLLLRGEGKKGWDPGEGKVGNTGFTLWRASDLAVALMDAMDAECAAEVRAKQSGASDQSATWGGVLRPLFEGAAATTRLRAAALPAIDAVYRPETADWRAALGGGGGGSARAFDKLAAARARGERPTFAACPLPLLTHPCGAYLRDRATFDETRAPSGGRRGDDAERPRALSSLSRFDDAFARAGATAERDAARLVVVHTNFVKGQVAKTNAMKGLGFWSLADGGEKLEKRSWPAMCAPFSGLRPAKQAAAAPAAQHASKKPSKKPSKPSKKPSSSSESSSSSLSPSRRVIVVIVVVVVVVIVVVVGFLLGFLLVSPQQTHTVGAHRRRRRGHITS